jgi:multicomponent Na+:H+ antiporter subunit E
MSWIKKTYHFSLFMGFYLVKLIEANFVIAYDILTPKMGFNPGMIEVDLMPSSNFGMLMLSNLVSMTPGTLSTELDLEGRKLHVHVLYLDRKEKIMKEILQIMKRMRRFINE